MDDEKIENSRKRKGGKRYKKKKSSVGKKNINNVNGYSNNHSNNIGDCCWNGSWKNRKNKL